MSAKIWRHLAMSPTCRRHVELSSEWTNDNEGSNMIEDQPSDEELTAGRITKKKLAEGEDSHVNVSTTAMVVNALTPDNNNHYFQQQ